MSSVFSYFFITYNIYVCQVKVYFHIYLLRTYNDIDVQYVCTVAATVAPR